MMPFNLCNDRENQFLKDNIHGYQTKVHLMDERP